MFVSFALLFAVFVCIILLTVDNSRFQAQLLLTAVSDCFDCIVRSQAVGSAAPGRLPWWCRVLSIPTSKSHVCFITLQVAAQVQRSRSAGSCGSTAHGFSSRASGADLQLSQKACSSFGLSFVQSFRCNPFGPLQPLLTVVRQHLSFSADLQPGFSRTFSYKHTDAVKGEALL